jgi:hypothetical protein
MTPLWTIFYSDGTHTSGSTRAQWDAAHNEDVQAVVLWKRPEWWERPWAGVGDRFVWTGDDEYNPFGNWDEKQGSLIPDKEYAEIARRAFYEPLP